MNLLKKPLKILLFSAVLHFFFQIPAGPVLAEDIPHVLVINSYHKGYKWSDTILDGLVSMLPDDVELHVEYMDTKRHLSEEYFDLLKRLYLFKYENQKFNAVVASDDNAFQFALENHETLFPNIPVVFCGVSRFSPDLIQNKPLFTGVVEKNDYNVTLEMALKLHPDARTIHVIVDRSTSGAIQQEEIQKIWEKFPRITFRFHGLAKNLSASQLIDRMSRISPSSIVYYSNYFRDGSGHFVDYRSFLEQLSRKCPAPIYVNRPTYMGYGVMGGYVVSPLFQGKTAGKMVRDILEGASVSTISPVLKSPNRFIFDYQQLRRFEVKTGLLPPKSEIMNRPEDFFQRHKIIIMPTLLVVILLFVIIIFLAITIYRREKSEQDLKKSEQRFRSFVENAHDIVYSLTPEGIFTYVSPNWEFFFQEKPQKAVGQSFEKYVVPDDIPICRAFLNRVLQVKTPQSSVEYRVITTSGKIRWHTSTGSPLFNKGGRLVGYMGISRDITEQKRGEEELKRYENLVYSAREPMAVIDRNYTFLMINSSWLKFWDKKRGQVLGKQVPDITGTDLFEGLLKGNMDRCFNGETIRYETWIGSPSGEQRFFQINYYPYRTGEEISGLISIAYDITDRKLAEEKLRESEEKFSKAFHSNPIMMTISTVKEGRFVDVNETFLKSAGFSRKEVIGALASDLGIWGKVDRKSLVSEIMEKGFAHYKDVEMVTRSGRVLNMLWCGDRVRIQNQDCLLVSAYDQTEIKKAQKALRESEERLELALESVRDAVWDWRIDTGEVYYSPRWFTMLGYEPGQMPGEFETWENLVHPEDLPRAKQIVFSHLKSGKPFEMEVRMKTGEAEWRWVLSRGKVVEKDTGGNPVRMLGTHMDVTERNRMLDRLKQAQKMEAIGTLAGGIAHDFNNILSPLVGWAEILKEQLPAESPMQNHVDEILKAAWRSRDLVLRILAFSKGQDSEAKPTELQPVIREAVKLLRSSIPTTIDIKTRIDPECPMVLADGVQIHRILMNLATNAYHAMEKTGGTLFVSLQPFFMETDQLPQDDLPPGRYAMLRVSDTGSGIEKSILDKIFDPYFTTKEKNKGTGLGLSVVRGIVQSFKGDIRIYSEPGHGTEAQVFLPLVDEGAAIGPDEQPEDIVGGTEHILVVDDEKPIVLMAEKMLAQLGYRVTAHTASTKALESVKSDPDAFDLVITDMTMPKMTGLELARKIKAIRPDLPVIICTGFSDRVDESKCRELGIDGYMMKPVGREKLAKHIRKVLEARKSN